MTESRERGGLGLKDLQAFNDALLAKQLMRLIVEPNSLMSKVMKQKYYPKGDLFHAKVTSQASWLWRSWASSRYLLHEGCVWRVGDGKTVQVWEDKWLPADFMPSPISPKPENCEVRVVADLRDNMGEDWNQRLLERFFNETERGLITKVPLSSLGTKDKLV